MDLAASMDIAPSVLAGLTSGDPVALEACYDAFGRHVYRICKGMLGQDTDAEDATQEVFLKVFERARQFESRSSFSTWLHTLTVNHCLHRIERESRRRCEPIERAARRPDASPGPLDRAEHRDETQRAEDLLARLSPHQRAVLVLRELEALSYAEISEVLDVPVGTVMSRLARARQNLTRLAKPTHTSTRHVS